MIILKALHEEPKSDFELLSKLTLDNNTLYIYNPSKERYKTLKQELLKLNQNSVLTSSFFCLETHYTSDRKSIKCLIITLKNDIKQK